MTPKNHQPLRSIAAFVFLVLCGTSFPLPAHAIKVDLLFGGFSFEANTASSSGSVSGVGNYKVGLSFPVLTNLELGLGYTLIMSDTVGGDAAFGIDAEAAWYPWSPSGPLIMESDNSTVKTNTLWRPFAYFSYNVRQFQSVETQYNGFGIGAGVERALIQSYDLKFLLRYGSFAGPNESEATEISFLGGITFSI